MSTPVSVIIPVLDQWPLTERCLRTLAEHSPDSLEVLVVDNASTDATPTSCPPLGQALFGKRFNYLRQETNLNFGPANNLGAANACGDHLFLLNNDTELRPDWLPPLLRALANPKIGAAGPRLLYPDGRVQHVGITFAPQLGTEHIFEYFPGDHPAALNKRRCQAITAAALMMRADLFRELGGFFEGFRNGSEDLDLCARIRQRGLQLSVCPESVVIHHTSQSVGRFDHDDANAALLCSRQPRSFIPDLHLFARQAGFRLRLTPWLTPYVDASGPQPAWQGSPEIHVLRQLLQREPLWQEGYGLLVSAAVAEGDWALALEGAFLQSRFFPSLKHYGLLRKIATDVDMTPLAQDVEQKIRVIGDRLSDRPKLIATAKTLAAHFRAASEPELHVLYRDWLAENDPRC